MGITVIGFLVGAVVSLGASWVLVTRLEMVGERLHFSEALLGVITALAADAPEVTSAISALVHHQRDVSTGVVLGSNVFNLAALLGLSAVVAGRIVLHRRAVAVSGVVALSMALIALALVTGAAPPPLALGLVAIFVVPYLVLLAAHRSDMAWVPLPRRWTNWLRRAVDEQEAELVEAIHPEAARGADVLLAVVALFVVLGASVLMERTATSLGEHLGISQIVVGGLVLAAVTSLPNAVAAVYLAARGRGAATMSTAMNSNTLNVLAGLVVPTAFVGLHQTSTATDLSGAWYLGLTAVALAFVWAQRGLSRVAGWVVIGAYVAFVAVLAARF